MSDEHEFELEADREFWRAFGAPAGVIVCPVPGGWSADCLDCVHSNGDVLCLGEWTTEQEAVSAAKGHERLHSKTAAGPVGSGEEARASDSTSRTAGRQLGTEHQPSSPARQREWCHERHLCHHWFEDECSSECDRGEHDGSHGHPGCTDRTSHISGSPDE